jgi:hypothetical protein
MPTIPPVAAAETTTTTARAAAGNGADSTAGASGGANANRTVAAALQHRLKRAREGGGDDHGGDAVEAKVARRASTPMTLPASRCSYEPFEVIFLVRCSTSLTHWDQAFGMHGQLHI